MEIGRILPGIAIISGRIFVCGGEVDSRILANGEVRHFENFGKKYRVAYHTCHDSANRVI